MSKTLPNPRELELMLKQVISGVATDLKPVAFNEVPTYTNKKGGKRRKINPKLKQHDFKEITKSHGGLIERDCGTWAIFDHDLLEQIDYTIHINLELNILGTAKDGEMVVIVRDANEQIQYYIKDVAKEEKFIGNTSFIHVQNRFNTNQIFVISTAIDLIILELLEVDYIVIADEIKVNEIDNPNSKLKLLEAVRNKEIVVLNNPNVNKIQASYGSFCKSIKREGYPTLFEKYQKINFKGIALEELKNLILEINNDK